jgi:hypothetical protein
MLSTLNRPEQDPHDVIEIAPDVVLAARSDQPSPTPATDAGSGPSAPEVRIAPAPSVSTPSVDTTFRATTLDDIRIPGERSPLAKWAIRTFMACLFAIGSAVAAAAWQNYGDDAQQMLTNWTPPRISLASLFSSSKPTASEQSAPPAAAAADQNSTQTATAQPAPTATPQSASAVATAPDATTPPTVPAAPSADATQLMQSMAHDITAMSQQIADLKTSIDQLKARQEQMSHDLAKTAEARIAEAKAAEAKAAEMRAFERQKIALPPRAAAALPPPVRKPKPAYTPVQAAAVPPPPPAAAPLPSSQPIAPLPPPQATVQPDGDAVVRPPMPVH